MGAEIDESSMTTGAVGDNTGCVGRRAVEGAGQPAETFHVVLRLRSLVCRRAVRWAGRGGEASDSENLPVQPGAVRD